MEMDSDTFLSQILIEVLLNAILLDVFTIKRETAR